MRKDGEIIIFTQTLFDGLTQKSNQAIVIKENKITDVSYSNSKIRCDYHVVAVTPAFIDAHSHIGMCRAGEPSSEEKTNDRLNQITPLVNPLNSIYFDDKSFSNAVDFGVLYSCVIPGSGNLLAGKAVIIRNFAPNRKEAFFKDYGYKMTLGYNPRSTTKWNGERPNTRMGVYALLEKRFDEVRQKIQKAELEKERAIEKLGPGPARDKEFSRIYREHELTLSPEDQCLLEILRGEKTVKIHVHKEDDIYYLIDPLSKYGLRVTAEHCCDVFRKEPFNALADCGIPIVYGPLGSLAYKVELKNESYKNVKFLMDSTAHYGLMTDHPSILAASLKDSLKYFLIQGMSESDSISLITYLNAKILGINDHLGTIEPDKLASLIAWDQNPFHLAAYPRLVMAEGKIIRPI